MCRKANGREPLFALGFGVAMLALLSGCDGGSANFRYRLMFTVEVNGMEKTASSIVNVHYYWGNSVEASGASGFSEVKGVAPVIDLGQGLGWLVAGLGADYAEHARRVEAFGLRCPQPGTAAAFGQVFAKEREELDRLSSGKRTLPVDLLPAFIWFPAGASYRQAQQICPEEFARVIDAGVKLRSVSVEVARDGPVLRRLEIKTPWLNEIRVEQRDSYSKQFEIYKPDRLGSIEIDY